MVGERRVEPGVGGAQRVDVGLRPPRADGVEQPRRRELEPRERQPQVVGIGVLAGERRTLGGECVPGRIALDEAAHREVAQEPSSRSLGSCSRRRQYAAMSSRSRGIPRSSRRSARIGRSVIVSPATQANASPGHHSASRIASSSRVVVPGSAPPRCSQRISAPSGVCRSCSLLGPVDLDDHLRRHAGGQLLEAARESARGRRTHSMRRSSWVGSTWVPVTGSGKKIFTWSSNPRLDELGELEAVALEGLQLVAGEHEPAHRRGHVLDAEHLELAEVIGWIVVGRTSDGHRRIFRVP